MGGEVSQLLIIIEIIGAACLILWITTIFLLRKEKKQTKKFKEKCNRQTLELDKEISSIKEENMQKLNNLQMEKNQQIERVHKEMKQLQTFYETDYEQKAVHLEKAFQDKTESMIKELAEAKKLNDDFVEVFPIEVKKKEDEIKEVFQKQLDDIINNLKADFEKEIIKKNNEIAKAQEIIEKQGEMIQAKKYSDETSEKEQKLIAKNNDLKEEIKTLENEKLSNSARFKLESKKLKADIEQEYHGQIREAKEDRARMKSELKAIEKQLKFQNKEERREGLREEDLKRMKAENKELEREITSHVKAEKHDMRDKEELIRTKDQNQELEEELKDKREKAKHVDILTEDLKQIKEEKKEIEEALKVFQEREEKLKSEDQKTPEALRRELNTVKLKHEKEIKVLDMRNIELEKQLRALMFRA